MVCLISLSTTTEYFRGAFEVDLFYNGDKYNLQRCSFRRTPNRFRFIFVRPFLTDSHTIAGFVFDTRMFDAGFSYLGLG